MRLLRDASDEIRIVLLPGRRLAASRDPASLRSSSSHRCRQKERYLSEGHFLAVNFAFGVWRCDSHTEILGRGLEARFRTLLWEYPFSSALI